MTQHAPPRSAARARRKVARVVRAAAVVFASATVAALAACGGARAPAVGSSETRPRPIKKDAGAREPFRSHAVATIGDRTIGPFVARRPGPRDRPDAAAALVTWVTPPEGTGRRIVSVALSGSGQPRGGERTVAYVPVDTTMLAVGALRGQNPGFVVAWTSLTDRGEALWAAVVGDDGVPRSKAVELARVGDDIVWIDIVPTDAGAVCLWAEETRGGDANVVAAALDAEGKVRGVPARVARGAAGWHALEIPGGVGVPIVSSPPPGSTSAPAGPASASAERASSRGGALSFQRLDVEGHPQGPPTIVTSAPVVSGDVEIARDGERIVLAWTDRSADEPFVAAAAVDARGGVEAPRRVVEARGGASLLGLASGPAGTSLLWEAPARVKAESRRVHVGRLGSSLALDRARLSFSVVGRATPELEATASGFAVLASLHDCDLGAPTCPSAPVAATLLRVAPTMELVQREPLSFGGDDTPLGWGLRCDGDDCFALTATAGSPSRIRSAEVRPNANAPPRPVRVTPSKDAPRLAELTELVSGESVVDIAAARFGDSTLLATLSARSDAARARSRSDRTDDPAVRAGGLVLATRVVDAKGASGPPVVLSTRALAVGGVAVAPAAKADDGGVIAWVARENGDPEVHVTRVDRRGRRTNDVQLTTTKGEAGDVNVVWAGGGWLVTWVDGRDGNGEVYATKVGLDLARTAREERITSAPGDASDLVALARGDVVWLAWADPRESPRDGMADIFVTSLRARDAKRASDEVRVLPTAPHSRTPHLAFADDGGLHLGWIEEAPLGLEAPSAAGYGAMWATLDATGKTTAKPVRLPLGGDGAATSIAVEARDGGVRAVMARSDAESISLDTALLAPGPLRAFPLLTLDGPPSLDVALVLHDGLLFFNDDGPAPQDRRARRARIAWP